MVMGTRAVPTQTQKMLEAGRTANERAVRAVPASPAKTLRSNIEPPSFPWTARAGAGQQARAAQWPQGPEGPQACTEHYGAKGAEMP